MPRGHAVTDRPRAARRWPARPAAAGQLPALGQLGHNFLRDPKSPKTKRARGERAIGGRSALGQLGHFVTENKSRRLDCHNSHYEIYITLTSI